MYFLLVPFELRSFEADRDPPVLIGWCLFVWLSAFRLRDNRNRQFFILHFSISQFDLETLMSVFFAVARSKTLADPATLRRQTTRNASRAGVTLLRSISPSLKWISDAVNTQLSSLLICCSASCSCSACFTDKNIFSIGANMIVTDSTY